MCLRGKYWVCACIRDAGYVFVWVCISGTVGMCLWVCTLGTVGICIVCGYVLGTVGMHVLEGMYIRDC